MTTISLDCGIGILYELNFAIVWHDINDMIKALKCLELTKCQYSIMTMKLRQT